MWSSAPAKIPGKLRHCVDLLAVDTDSSASEQVQGPGRQASAG